MHDNRTLDEERIFEHFGGKIQNDLNQILQSDNIENGEIDTSSLSKYVNLTQLPAYISRNECSFSILSLNCQSINSKFDDIKIILEEISNKSTTQLSAILLQESWLAGLTPDVSHFKLPGYNTFALGLHAVLMVV